MNNYKVLAIKHTGNVVKPARLGGLDIDVDNNTIFSGLSCVTNDQKLSSYTGSSDGQKRLALVPGRAN